MERDFPNQEVLWRLRSPRQRNSISRDKPAGHSPVYNEMAIQSQEELKLPLQYPEGITWTLLGRVPQNTGGQFLL
ncbi:hypothetical protein FKM82_018514 [Ascaphus truei]